MADEDSYVSYIEGCSAPVRDSYQLHAAVVEVIIHKNAEVKYSTVQNWFLGDNNTGGILNFVTKRALCEGEKQQNVMDAIRNRVSDYVEISQLHFARR